METKAFGEKRRTRPLDFIEEGVWKSRVREPGARSSVGTRGAGRLVLPRGLFPAWTPCSSRRGFVARASAKQGGPSGPVTSDNTRYRRI